MTTADYSEFLRSKAAVAPPTGIEDVPPLGEYLFPFQSDVTRWALRRGRAALFLDTGLGKTVCQCEFALQVLAYAEAVGIGDKVLILAPLAVADQTVKEAAKYGIEVHYCRSQSAVKPGITIANYDMLDHFDPDAFCGIVLDESSILKNFDGKFRTAIIEAFRRTPFKLACTATPAPNDLTEIGNHAEFLGIMSMSEMLATYFVHDGGETQKWRLKGHAEDDFWRWVCTWAVMVKRPSDLGYSDDGYILPELQTIERIIPATQEQARAQGLLFAEAAANLAEQREARRVTLSERVKIAAEIIAKDPDESWIIWCELNKESEELESAIPGAIQVRGNFDPDRKRQLLSGFSAGSVRYLITKPKIAGMGMNWQHCARIIDIGASHSFESTYQKIRRCWRFGQKRPVQYHAIYSELERNVVDNQRRKMAEAETLATRMREYTLAHVRENVRGAARESETYNPQRPMMLPAWVTSDFG